MTTRFADAFYFLALLNRGDAAHLAALRLAIEGRGRSSRPPGS
jgi:hypothetical protein